MGLKSDGGSPYIEAAFISRNVGERYREALDEVGRETGYEICVRPSANQDRIGAIARDLTPQAWGPRGEPRIYPEASRGVVQVAVAVAVDEGECWAKAASFEEATGFSIEWTPAGS